MTAPRILLPFSDDSTLFFACRMAELLRVAQADAVLGWMTDGSALSHRQMTQSLPDGPDLLIRNTAFRDPALLVEYDAIVVSRIFAPLRDMMRGLHHRASAHRPAVVAFQGGLDFTPERGFKHRLDADIVYVVPRKDVARYDAFAAPRCAGWQVARFGHPFFMRGTATPPRAEGDIYFFAQALSPATPESRMFIVRMLAELARRSPERDVLIKLRHLPEENRAHLHKEKHPYPALLEALGSGRPANLKLTACSMDAALEAAGRGITCTSTAAIDLIREGVPTQVFLDYPQNYLDPLVTPMRALFEGSGVITDLAGVMEAQIGALQEPWLEQMFCGPDLAHDVIASIGQFRERPGAVARCLPEVDARPALSSFLP
ncbi:MAG: hypothetical protein JXR14_05930 [Paracoccaceae bacterium]